MPVASKIMMAFGAVAVVCAVVGWGGADGLVQSGLAVGLAMFAAGAAAAQGRTSVRKTGQFIGLILPVVAAALFGWRSIDYWRTFASAGGRAMPAIRLTVMAVAALITLVVLIKLRAGDNTAARGYSILPLPARSTEATEKQPADRR